MAFIHPKYGLVTPAPDTRVNKLGHELKQLGESLETVLEQVDNRSAAAQSATATAQSAAQQANATASAAGVSANLAKTAAQQAQQQAQQAQQQAQQANAAAQQVAQATSNVQQYINSQVANIAAATTSRQGISQLATAQEVALGAAQNKTVTPYALKNGLNIDAGRVTSGTISPARLPQATTGARGAVQLATVQDIAAGSSDKPVTPQTLKTRARTPLWQGENRLYQGGYINLAEPVSQQLTGIVLVFAAWRNNELKPWDYQTQLVPAGLITPQQGREFTFLLATTGRTALKVVKIDDTRISGTHHNNVNDSDFFTLVAVYGI